MPYAVKVGRQTGILDSWKACQEQVDGYPGAKFKKFDSEKGATAYLKGKREMPTSGLCVSTFKNDHAIGYQGIWLPKVQVKSSFAPEAAIIHRVEEQLSNSSKFN